MHRPSPIYIPALDGLRAIAVLAVIAFHVHFLDILPGGFTGVDMFFVISGYVISQSLSERSALGFVDYLKDFYHRRFLRILPALLLVLFVSFLVSAMFMPQFWLSELINRTGFAAFFGLSNVVLAWNMDTYFSPGTELNPYVQTWSLGVEEQFYVIFPAIYFIWLRLKHHVKIVWAILPILALASLVLSAYQTQTDPLSAFYLLPGRFWELATGAMLFQIISARQFSLRSKGLAHSLLLGGAVLVMAGFFLAERRQFPFPWALTTVLGTMLMITAVVHKTEGTPSPLHRLLQSRLATYIGRLSYSLYLWHWPVLVFLRWTTGLEHLAVQLFYPVIVMMLAAASYHWVETPIRSGKSLLQKRAWVTVTSGLMAVCLFCWGAYWITDNTERLSLSQTRDTYTWHAYSHYPQEEISEINDPRVQGRQLFVIGDSHTAAYRTMLKIVSLKLGIKVVDFEQGGCGVVTLIGPDPAKCAERREADLKEIEIRAKPGDIVFLASLRMPELDGRELLHDDSAFNEALAELTPKKNKEARSSAETILARLEAAQVHVLIDAPKPLFKAPPNRCSDWFNRMNPICAPGLTMERSQLERLRASQMQLLETLKREHPDLTIWDPLPLLCPGSVCSAYAPNGKPLYFDSNHLSAHGNRILEPSFTEVLLTTWRNTGLEHHKHGSLRVE